MLQTNALILSPGETLNSVSCDGLGIYPIQLEMRVTTHATLNIVVINNDQIIRKLGIFESNIQIIPVFFAF